MRLNDTTRVLPDQDIEQLIAEIRTVVDDPAVQVPRSQRNTRPSPLG
jgi:hypothetical protein